MYACSFLIPARFQNPSQKFTLHSPHYGAQRFHSGDVNTFTLGPVLVQNANCSAVTVTLGRNSDFVEGCLELDSGAIKVEDTSETEAVAEEEDFAVKRYHMLTIGRVDPQFGIVAGNAAL